MSGRRRRRSNIGRSTVNARRVRSARDGESSTEHEARLSQVRDRYRAERERETSVEREVRRSRDRDRHRIQRSRESSARLTNSWDAKKEDTANRRKRKQDASDALIEIATKRFASEKKKNPTEIITDSWAVRLDRMESTQRILCEKFIEDILFEGQMGTLHRNSVHLNVNDVRTPLHLSIPPVYESSQESTPRHQSSCSTPIYQDVVTKEESISPNSSIQEQQSSCSTVVLDEVVTKEESISPTSSMSKYFSTFHQ